MMPVAALISRASMRHFRQAKSRQRTGHHDVGIAILFPRQLVFRHHRDEDAAHLGEALKLPKQHEHLRPYLEQNLQPIDG